MSIEAKLRVLDDYSAASERIRGELVEELERLSVGALISLQISAGAAREKKHADAMRPVMEIIHDPVPEKKRRKR